MGSPFSHSRSSSVSAFVRFFVASAKSYAAVDGELGSACEVGAGESKSELCKARQSVELLHSA